MALGCIMCGVLGVDATNVVYERTHRLIGAVKEQERPIIVLTGLFQLAGYRSTRLR